MTKLKTHKGLSKVCKKSSSGTIKITKAGKNHKTGSKNSAYNRNKRKSSLLSKGDFNRLKDLI